MGRNFRSGPAKGKGDARQECGAWFWFQSRLADHRGVVVPDADKEFIEVSFDDTGQATYKYVEDPLKIFADLAQQLVRLPRTRQTRLLAVFNFTELALVRRKVSDLAFTDGDGRAFPGIKSLQELISDESRRKSEAIDNGDDDQALRDIETLRALIHDELHREF